MYPDIARECRPVSLEELATMAYVVGTGVLVIVGGTCLGLTMAYISTHCENPLTKASKLYFWVQDQCYVRECPKE